MSERDEEWESTEESPELEPEDEAKEAMLESAKESAEEAEPQPTTQPEPLLEESEVEAASEPEPEEAVEPDLAVEEQADEAEAQEEPQIDLNTATMDDLRQLPGIGATLAERIVNYREKIRRFEEPSQLTEVEGISDATYEALAPRLMVGPAVEAEGEEEPPAELEEGVISPPVDEGIPVPELDEEAIVSPVEEEVVVPEVEAEAVEQDEIPTPVPEPPPIRVITEQDGGWGRLLLVGVIGALLGALLALVALVVINGTLNFRTAALRDLQRERFRVEGELDVVRTELGQLQGQIMDMQDLSARVDQTQADIQRLGENLLATRTEMESMVEALDALQTEFPNLREDLDAVALNVSEQGKLLTELAQQLAVVSEDLEAIGETTARFEDFLGGLRHLLNESMGPPTPTAWQTPTAFPTPALGVTRTPSANVTVIPAMTPTPTPTP